MPAVLRRSDKVTSIIKHTCLFSIFYLNLVQNGFTSFSHIHHSIVRKFIYTGRIDLLLSSRFNTPNFTNLSTISFVFPTPLLPLISAICLKVGLCPNFFHHSSTIKNTSLCAGLISLPKHSSYVTLTLFAISRLITTLALLVNLPLKIYPSYLFRTIFTTGGVS